MTSRYQYLQELTSRLTDQLLVCNVGGVNRELASLKPHPGNLYHVWMAGPTSVALGLAMSLPRRQVISLDGDGSILMGLSILPAIAHQHPSNLTVIIFDNECYEATARLPSFTADTVDLVATARGLGLNNVWLVHSPEELGEALQKGQQVDGPAFINAKVADPSEPMYPPSLGYGPENKFHFVRYIEETEGLQIIKPPLNWRR